MKNLRRGLPPMSGLVSFEAVARLASFSAAADELNLTQAAVSRNVRVLEENLGVTLIDRGGRRMTLTAAGHDFYAGVAVLLAQLHDEARRVRASHAKAPLEVAVSNAMASLWLFPRMPRFRKSHPDARIRLICCETDAEVLGPEIEVAITYGKGYWAEYDAELLFDEDAFPVCSPAYLEEYGPIDGPEDLRRHTLIKCEFSQPDWPDWQKWLRRQGVRDAVGQQWIRFNDYRLSVEAARDGLGIVLGGTQFLWRDLTRRTLVKPFESSIPTGWGYYLLQRRNTPTGRELATFRAWLQSVVAEVPSANAAPRTHTGSDSWSAPG